MEEKNNKPKFDYYIYCKLKCEAYFSIAENPDVMNIILSILFIAMENNERWSDSMPSASAPANKKKILKRIKINEKWRKRKWMNKVLLFFYAI